jgi:hypothetical protein
MFLSRTQERERARVDVGVQVDAGRKDMVVFWEGLSGLRRR